MRNEVEHHYTTAHKDAIRGLISDAFVLVRDFMATELHEDPAEALGWDVWNRMLSVSEVIERERADCAAALVAVDWGSAVLADAVKGLRCSECGSSLLMPDGQEPELACRSCGCEESRERYAARAVREHLALDSWVAFKEGSDLTYISCPFCCCETYIVSEQQCANCEESCVHVCSRCEMEIPAEELSDGSLCGWCSHMAAKA